MRKNGGVERRCKPEEVRRGEVQAENPDGVSIGRVGSTLQRETLRVLLRVAPPLLRIELSVFPFFLLLSGFSRNLFLNSVWDSWKRRRSFPFSSPLNDVVLSLHFFSS